jgi:hypothetical protein
VYAFYNNKIPLGNSRKKLQIQTETSHSDDGNINATLNMTGTGSHTIEIKTFNCTTEKGIMKVTLSSGKPGKIDLKLTGIDHSKPYVAVICVDNNPDLRKEIVGSFIKASL